MSHNTNLTSKRPPKSFRGVLLGVLVVLSLLFLTNSKASAANFENNYIGNIHFYYDAQEDLVFEFDCKATFQAYDMSQYGYYTYVFITRFGGYYDIANPYFNNLTKAILPNLTDGKFIAGQHYKILLRYLSAENWPYNGTLTKAKWEQFKGAPMTSEDFLQSYILFSNVVPDYTILAYYEERPTISISFPPDNAEVSAKDYFLIQGQWTQPSSGNLATSIEVSYAPAGILSCSTQKFSVGIPQGATTGGFSVRIDGIPAGYYDFHLFFRGGDWDGFEGATIYNIHIVNDLPPSLPSWGGEPPITAPSVFDLIATSTISTSTGLYTTLTNVFAPVILSVGQNLIDFAKNFTLSNASSTGSQVGQAILFIRGYTDSLNSFFGDFPVSQFLLLYLIALFLVIVFRVVKSIINLFKI